MLKHIRTYIGAGLLSLFLIMNISFSQFVHPVYFQVAQNEPANIANYLKVIRPLPEFEAELEANVQMFGKQLQGEVFFEEREQKKKIAVLEALLERNPKARDVLLSLSALHEKLGNSEKAREYFNQAKEIDPAL